MGDPPLHGIPDERERQNILLANDIFDGGRLIVQAKEGVQATAHQSVDKIKVW